MPGKTRLTLLERVRTSTDDDAWKEFADLYEKMIVDWLIKQGIDQSDAEDVRQEVMATVHNEIGEFEHNGREGAFRNWLRQITANRMRRLWQKKASKVAENSGTNFGDLGEQLADSKSRLTLVWETQHNQFVVNQLMTKLTKKFTDKHLAAFRRIVLQEEPAQKVADDYAMTLGAVRVVQHRVLRALKELGQGLID